MFNNKKKVKPKIAGRIARYLSYFCFFICIAGVVTLISGEFKGQDFAMLIFFIVLGAALFMYSKKQATNSEKYKKYISIIIDGNEFKIDNIADAMSLPVSDVMNDLNDMIKEGYLQNAYINNKSYEIVMINNNSSNIAEQAKVKVVTCKSCGAKNKVTNNNTECDYCGTTL